MKPRFIFNALIGASSALALACFPTSVKADEAGGANDLVAQLLQRVSSLEAEQRELRGDVDQLTNQLKTQSQAFSKKLDDMQFANGQKAAAPAASGAVDEAASASSSDGEKSISAEDAIKQGKAALASRDYPLAQLKAQAALKMSHDQRRKVEARFLLAQSLAGQKDYKASALAYFDAYKAAPRAESAQQSLLGVSASMLALGRKKDACEALKKLKLEFLTPSPRIKKAYSSFFRRAQCE